MKRVMILTLAVTASIVFAVYAQQPPRRQQQPRRNGDGPPRFELGRVFPPFVREELDLSSEQEKQIDALEKEVKTKLNKILTVEQKKRVESIRPPGPPGVPGDPFEGPPPGPDDPPRGRGGPPPEGPKGRLPGGPAVAQRAKTTPESPSFGSGKENAAPTAPDGLMAIGGRWYVREGETKRYFYRDSAKFVDLFSNQIMDSNKNGIDDLKISHDSKFLILHSQGLPNHPHAKFPNSGNPNTIRVQDFTFKLPLEPKPADVVITVPMGEIGVALNGVVFFNPFEAGGMNAVEGYSEVWFDACCGHPQQHGVYHYHKYPSCLKTPFPDDGETHSPVIGFAWDGFPVYGPYESAARMAKDLQGEKALDVCNGHFDADRGYHYHATPGKFPYMIGGYAGVPERSNNRGLGRAGTGVILDTASGESREGTGIVAVKPGTANRGKTHEIRIELNPHPGGGRIPSDAPSRIVIGPFEASRISRDGNTISCEITVPTDANKGAMFDCHLEFAGSGRGGITAIKKNNVFRVGGE